MSPPIARLLVISTALATLGATPPARSRPTLPAEPRPTARPEDAPRPTPRPRPPSQDKAPLVQAPLALRANGAAFAHEVMSAFVLPGETMPIEILTPPGAEAYVVESKDGQLETRSPTRWTWRAPAEPGIYEIDVADPARNQKTELRVFVMVPFERVRNGRLNGYRIGQYPAPQTPAHAPPRGFIEVTPGNKDKRVTPHFRLEQFLCKQPSDYPKYVVLDDRLLLKLESILAAVNKAGHRSETLHVMSAYRTPFYNAAIENVKFSQHQWGTAADIFVDAGENEMMDDLDGDEKIDKADARVLFGIIDRMDREPDARFPGGLGAYGGTKAHGPFVHVDVRGRLARW